MNALIERGEFIMIAIGPVAKTQIGEKDMQFAAGAEFDTFEKAMSFKNHPDYVDALNELGDSLLYTSPSPRDATLSLMPSSA